MLRKLGQYEKVSNILADSLTNKDVMPQQLIKRKCLNSKSGKPELNYNSKPGKPEKVPFFVHLHYISHTEKDIYPYTWG